MKLDLVNHKSIMVFSDAVKVLYRVYFDDTDVIPRTARLECETFWVFENPYGAVKIAPTWTYISEDSEFIHEAISMATVIDGAPVSRYTETISGTAQMHGETYDALYRKGYRQTANDAVDHAATVNGRDLEKAADWHRSMLSAKRSVDALRAMSDPDHEDHETPR